MVLFSPLHFLDDRFILGMSIRALGPEGTETCGVIEAHSSLVVFVPAVISVPAETPVVPETLFALTVRVNM